MKAGKGVKAEGVKASSGSLTSGRATDLRINYMSLLSDTARSLLSEV